MIKDKNKAAIIFDFDGTIADSFVTTIQVIYKATHHTVLPDEDISRLRSLNMYQLSRALHISWWRLLFLTKRVRRLMRDEMNGITLVPGMDGAIKSLSSKYKLFILSSNSTENVMSLFQKYEISSYFSGIYGYANPISKKRKLAELIEQNGLLKFDTSYIGDEVQDIKAAKKVGIKAVGVTWGYSNPHLLKRQKPDELVFSPDELRVLFNVQ